MRTEPDYFDDELAPSPPRNLKPVNYNDQAYWLQPGEYVMDKWDYVVIGIFSEVKIISLSGGSHYWQELDAPKTFCLFYSTEFHIYRVRSTDRKIDATFSGEDLPNLIFIDIQGRKNEFGIVDKNILYGFYQDYRKSANTNLTLDTDKLMRLTQEIMDTFAEKRQVDYATFYFKEYEELIKRQLEKQGGKT